MKSTNTKLIVMMEIAILAALSMGLDWLDTPFKIGPYSFSFSMVPIIILAVRRGVGPGMIGGLIWSILQIITGNAAGWIVHPVQLILDYPLAFMLIGVAGVAAKNRTLLNVLLWTLIAIFLRYTSHFFAGWFFFGSYAPEGQPAWLYSLIVNGSTFLANAAICLIFVGLLFFAGRRLFIPAER